MVNSAWMNVPRKSHARDLGPMWSPMRPRDAPAMKVSTEHSACWSAMWKEVSRWPGGPEKSRARARASWTELPVWKPHQTKMAVKETESLGRAEVSLGLGPFGASKKQGQKSGCFARRVRTDSECLLDFEAKSS